MYSDLIFRKTAVPATKSKKSAQKIKFVRMEDVLSACVQRMQTVELLLSASRHSAVKEIGGLIRPCIIA